MIFGWGEMRLGTAATGEVDVSWPRGADPAREREDRGGPRRAGGRALPALRAPRLARRGRAADLRARRAARAGDERPRQRRGRRRGPRPPRGRGRRPRTSPRPRPCSPGCAGRSATPRPSPRASPAPARFRGLWRGTVDWPVFEGRFEGEDVGYVGVDWGRAEWTGTLDTAAEAVESRPLVLRKGAGEIRWDGPRRDRLVRPQGRDRGPRPRSRRGRSRTSSRSWSGTSSATGLVTGEAQVRGRRSAPEGEAKGTARGGRYYAMPYDAARIESRWKGRVAEVTRARSRLGGGTVAFRGTRDRRRRLRRLGRDGGRRPRRARARARAGRRLRRPALRPPRDAGHARRGRACARASPRPASSSATRASAPSRRASSGRATAGSRSTGAAAPRASTWRSPAPWAPRRPTRRTSRSPRARRASTPSCARSQPALPATLALVASGEVRIRGPLRDARPRSGPRPSSPTCSSSCPSSPSARASRCGSPSPTAGSSSRDLHLAGEGTDLAVTGGADLARRRARSPSPPAGRRTCARSSLVTRRLRGTGAARLAVDVSGTRAAPRVAGHPRPRGGRPARARLPARRRGPARAACASPRARPSSRSVSGTLAGGRLTIEGQAAYAGRAAHLLRHPPGRAAASPCATPRACAACSTPQLRLFGDAAKQWITGTVDVRQALYTKRYDVASELLGARARPPAARGALARGGRAARPARARARARCASTTTSPPSPRAPTSRSRARRGPRS